MPFDKEAQRARLAGVESQMLAKGFKKPPPAQVLVTSRGPNPQMAQFMNTVNRSPRYSVPAVAAAVSTALKNKEPKMAVNYSAEPFTNSLGQTIQLGQKVIFVSQGYNHSTKVGIGEYLGLRRDSRGQVRNVVVTRTIEKYGYQLKGKSVKYGTPGATYAKFMHTGKTSLPSKRIYPTV